MKREEGGRAGAPAPEGAGDATRSELGRAMDESAYRKMLVMERSVAQLRAIVIGLNIVTYFMYFGLHAPRAPLAFAIVAVAFSYALWSLIGEPYARYPLLRFGLLTLTMDAILIALWILATGGPRSEFWVIYIVSVVSVAMRYDFRRTVIVSLGEAAMYSAVMAADGGVRGIGAITRPGYILIAGLAAAYLSRQEQFAREELVRVERLEQERKSQLQRERDEVRHLREVDRMKTDFVAHASHELRTPLTTLSGLATTLAVHRERMTDEMIADALLSMRRQGERVKVLVENLLDLSQLEHGDMRLEIAPVEVADVIDSALDSAPPPADRSITIDVDDDARALADRGRLEQILVNLLMNAYRYGGEEISCVVNVDGDDVVIHLHDDGPGIPAETVPQLFEPFRRGTNVGGIVGSGLGLVISRRLAEASGGELWYEPAPEGTTFGVRLKRAS